MPHSFSPRPGLNLKAACRDRGCTLQDLVNDALEVYLKPNEKEHQANPAAEPPNNQPEYILHKSNPSIMLVKELPHNGRTAYVDTEGRRWLMNSDKTLLPIGTLAYKVDESTREVINKDGTIDVYKNGKLDAKKIPPKQTGGMWTYRIYV